MEFDCLPWKIQHIWNRKREKWGSICLVNLKRASSLRRRAVRSRGLPVLTRHRRRCRSVFLKSGPGTPCTGCRTECGLQQCSICQSIKRASEQFVLYCMRAIKTKRDKEENGATPLTMSSHASGRRLPEARCALPANYAAVGHLRLIAAIKHPRSEQFLSLTAASHFRILNRLTIVSSN